MRRLLSPTSVAVVGATERPGAYGSEAILNLERIGFSGSVVAVNPSRSSVHGVPCVPVLDDAVDAVVVAVPADGVTAVIEDAGRLGCGGAVVFAAGFAEASGGAGRQADLVSAARSWGLPVCGPNGNGIVSPWSRAALWGDMVPASPAGPVALVTQSGNVAVNALASRRGLRLHTVVSCGNAAVVSPAEYVSAIAELDGVRSIALYLEDDGDAVGWCDALALCASRGIGVAVLKAGSSPAGAAAAQAHTGAIAGDQRAVRAFFEECGAAWAEDPHELLEFAKALATSRRGGGSRCAVMTCSGGDSSVAADLAQRLDVDLSPLSDRTVMELRSGLPAAATVQNPLDYTSLLWDDPDALASVVSVLGADVDRVLVLYDEPAGLEGAAAASWAAVLDAIRLGASRSAAPVMVASTLPELLSDSSAAALAADGLPAVAGLRTGLRAAAVLGAPAPDPARIGELCALTVALAPPRAHNVAEWLAEHETKALLRANGIPVPPGYVTSDAHEAATIAAALDAAVAVKATGREIQHKSQLDAVRLHVVDVRAAAEDLLRVSGEVLVEAMVPPGTELLVAVRTDTIVPVLVIGLGGALAEILSDVVVLPLPVTRARLMTVLGRWLGDDVEAAADLALKAAAFAIAERLTLLELNPVIVGPEGAIAVDAIAAPQPVKEEVLA